MTSTRAPEASPQGPRGEAACRDWDRAYDAHPHLAAGFPWDHVVEVLTAHPGKRLYEIGFGSGSNLKWATAAGWEVAGCEVATVPFSLGTELLPDADLRRESMVDCSAPSDSYDVVIDRAALSYLSPRDLKSAIAHARRILKPGGVFFFNPYGAEHTKPFPEFAPEPTRWDQTAARRLFPDTKWETINFESFFAKYEGDEQNRFEHTLRILVRKLA